jgi:ribosomal protein S18 acetylase RimI-like enzyme
MTHPLLREARSDDYPVLASWLPDADSAWRWSGAELRFPLKPAGLEALVEVDAGGSHVLVQADDQPLAFGQFWITQPGVVQLGRLIVAPAARRHGHGRQLCKALIDAAFERHGTRIVTLQVPPNEIPARNLFTRLGFQAVPAESSPGLLFMRTMVRRPAA